ncbi:UPF0262 family protein [Sinorhizobium mexicanum]|uniref:UPF0262 family protein n=1 Tax=Sinorhizobium mexicanum TaxID=375549 RepID=A0A859QEK7_9HYPH|nr:UPF0262 family protein [Sinorhizobium mexicanum]MBP1885126.1 uncharacterized protein (UPF0262 family) [Sinorhizobium mexicanum]QLL64383.1 UPF0262 family protein [Sinorhizobium mexicanum]
MTCARTAPSLFRLCAISLDPPLGCHTDATQKREQAVAIFDLLDNNRFAPIEHRGGPYRLRLSLVDRRLVMSVTAENGAPVLCHHLSLTSFRRLLMDYRLVCESYASTEARLTSDRLEAIDMGRRTIHDEASALLIQRLKLKIEIDRGTARRLFTLIHLLVSQQLLGGGHLTRKTD